MVYTDRVSRDQIRTRLSDLGERRAAVRAELETLSADITVTVKRAHSAGIPKVEIAALARISRPALDDMLKR